MKKFNGELTYKNESVSCVLDSYRDGTPAIQVYDEEGIPYFTATVNMSKKLPDNQTAIKDYSENKGVLDWLIYNDIVTPTKKVLSNGYVNCSVVTVNMDKFIEI